MIRLRSIVDAGHAARLRAGGDDDLLASRSSVCLSPSVTSTVPLPASRAGALDPVDLVLLEQELDAAGEALDDLVLARLDLGHVDADRRPRRCVRPHSFQFCAIFSACACSSSALVGMQPQFRQVPPSAGARSTTAVFSPSCAARMAAT